jgi:hypothetical protein
MEAVNSHNRGTTMKTIQHVARPLAALGIMLALAACGEKSAVEDAVRQNLKDPDSARFSTFYYSKNTKRACITVNAKNSMGGYTGDKEIQLQRGADGWEWVSENELGEDYCKRAWADAKDE